MRLSRFFIPTLRETPKEAEIVSHRLMPARSISRCETISASFGVSRRVGMKKRDRRILG